MKATRYIIIDRFHEIIYPRLYSSIEKARAGIKRIKADRDSFNSTSKLAIKKIEIAI